MRFFLAGTVGLTLGLGSTFAQNPYTTWPQPAANNASPSVSLGRPIPAASLGRPMPASSPELSLQPAGFRPDPYAGMARPMDAAPLLAPVSGMPISTDQPKPLPADGGSSAVAPMPPPGRPSAGPMYGSPNPGCATCGPVYGYGGDPGFMGMPMMDSGFGGCPSRFYASADFLLWWVPSMTTPLPIALASTQPFTGGALPPTTVAVGSTGLISNTMIGGKFGGGFWFDPCHKNGLDANFFFVGPTSRDIFVTTSAALPTLLRPYVVINDPVAGGTPPATTRPNFADIVAQNGDNGSVAVHTESFFTGADLNFRHNLYVNCCGGLIDALIGFRFLHLNESIRVTETGAQTTNGVTTTGTITDSFQTTNNFYGSQIGLIAQRQWGPWSIDFSTKFGVGSNMSTVGIAGSAAFNNPAANFNQGLFAQPSNIGTWRSSHFSVVSDTGLNLGFNVTPRMRLQLGYSILYWSNVLRAGDQIDPIVDQTLVPVPPGTPAQFLPLNANNPHPVVPFKRSDYWAQGINFGVTFRW